MRIAVFISGGGTTLRNLITRIERGLLEAEIALVISSSATATGLQFAGDAGIPTRLVRQRAFNGDAAAYSAAMFDPCRDRHVDLVVMGGFLKHVWIPDDFYGRVINIHPSLIPAFCGAAMYGQRVHAAVIDRGVKISGCTVHYVDNEFDNGPIILQRSCPVQDDDTPESLAARVFELECEALPEAIRRIDRGELEIRGRRVIRRRSEQ